MIAIILAAVSALTKIALLIGAIGSVGRAGVTHVLSRVQSKILVITLHALILTGLDISYESRLSRSVGPHEGSCLPIPPYEPIRRIQLANVSQAHGIHAARHPHSAQR
ncbi:MAG TPA: hypothetical protein VIH42_09535 [Thermoguttaceae bacterium]